MARVNRVEVWVFLILLGSYAYFWQARDWNSASRLMLTYAVVDRGTISIDGLEDQTHDRALFRGRYYTDKLPGFSILATGPYVLAKLVFRLPDHPLKARGFAYWPADYWVTLGSVHPAAVFDTPEEMARFCEAHPEAEARAYWNGHEESDPHSAHVFFLPVGGLVLGLSVAADDEPAWDRWLDEWPRRASDRMPRRSTRSRRWPRQAARS